MTRHRGLGGLSLCVSRVAVVAVVSGLAGCTSGVTMLDGVPRRLPARGRWGFTAGTGTWEQPVSSAPPPSAETARPLASAAGERRTNQGFRMGLVCVDGAGDLADWLEDHHKSKGTQFFALGYQFEIQRGAEGETNTLVEIIPSIAGMAQSWVIPSVNILVGLRFPNGFEFGAGPHFAARKRHKDDLEDRYAWDGVHVWGLGLTVGVGVTFEAQAEEGSLRIPIGLSAGIAADGVTYSFTFGFNLRRR